MKKEVKELWVRALRSEDYHQGHGALRTRYGEEGEEDPPVKHCCLGVLCELSGLEYESAGWWLPTAVQEWAGISVPSPELQHGDEWLSIDVLNDEVHLTFEELADLIEKQL